MASPGSARIGRSCSTWPLRRCGPRRAGAVADRPRPAQLADPELRACLAAIRNGPAQPRFLVEPTRDPADVARIAELETAIRAWIAASDTPASSGNRGEVSVRLARYSDGEQALPAVVGGPIPEHVAAAPGVQRRAELLEQEVAGLRRRGSELETALAWRR